VSPATQDSENQEYVSFCPWLCPKAAHQSGASRSDGAGKSCARSRETMMKVIRLTLALVLLASCVNTPALAAPAAPPPTSKNQGADAELLQFCADLIEGGEFPALVLGECMSFNITSYQGFKAHFCDYIRSNDLWDDFGVTSYSDCIRNVEY
jgi:hypothetical protein